MVAVLVAWLASACAIHPRVAASDLPTAGVATIRLYDHALNVHFSRPRQAGDRPLLLYATGDGGWRGKDKEVFDQLAGWNYPVAGFSAPDYLSHLGFESGTTTPRRLGRDYERLIAFAQQVMRLPAGRPTILVGVSRGAGLAVVAAGQAELRPELAGVLAVGLTKEEEYVRRYRVRRDSPSDMPRRELLMVQTYEYLPRLLALRVAVIQSTQDNYLPADQARRLFGPDTETRRFHPIEARNHSFGGARAALYDEMKTSLEWMSARSDRTH